MKRDLLVEMDGLEFPLVVEHEPSGGYDCMTPAFVVKANGKELFTVDVKEFLPRDVTEKDPRFVDAMCTAKRLAEFAVHTMNGHDALVEALDAAMTEMEAISKSTGVSIEDFECWQKCRDAIAQEE